MPLPNTKAARYTMVFEMNRFVGCLTIGLALMLTHGCGQSNNAENNLGHNASTDSVGTNSEENELNLQEKAALAKMENDRKENVKKGLEKTKNELNGTWLEVPPELDDPNYYEKLIKLAKKENGLYRSSCLEQLLEANPSKVTPEIHRKIANTFRDLSENDQSILINNVVLRGYVKWCGEEALVALLERVEDNHSLGIDDTVYEVLASTKDPRAAKALTKQIIRNPLAGDLSASGALEKMGPSAEEALLEVASSESNPGFYYVVNLLGASCGTERSLFVLEKVAAKSRKSDVQQSINKAIKQITKRLAKNKRDESDKE